MLNHSTFFVVYHLPLGERERIVLFRSKVVPLRAGPRRAVAVEWVIGVYRWDLNKQLHNVRSQWEVFDQWVNVVSAIDFYNRS